MMGATILQGDCIEQMRTLHDASVHCCVTSPPYYGLRDYGHEGQIGLEETPDAYVAKLVEVFREVRRVLRDDGTLWLNLGDSYANTGGGSLAWSTPTEQAKKRVDAAPLPKRDCSSLKPKDLIGIPWRVAFALQQPYYTGTIRDERDRIWLAAMLDAEGCMFIHKRKAGQSNGQGYERQNDSYSPGVEIANTSLAIIERIHQLVGKGSICSQTPEQNERRKQTIYRWNLRTTECRDFVRELYPHIVAKQQQARILCGCPSSGERAEAAHAALIALHRTALSDVDFPAPVTMFEKGYYLRQDLVWSKPNPMPESVTDRCTKAHEFIFLLSKSERYHYDSDAIKEAAVGGSPGNRNPVKSDGTEKTRTRAGLHAYAERQRERGHLRQHQGFNEKWDAMSKDQQASNGRNKRSVWTVATKPYKHAHFATFPPKLIEPCILAGCPAGGTVLDPFGGSGTTAAVAVEHGRNAVVCELNAKYVAMAQARIAAVQPPLFT